MIISHKYKFIFLKSKKTAGTSIEISLSRYCGEDDIITPIAPEDEEIRARFGIKPQNYMDENNKKPKFFNHYGAKKIANTIGKDIWSSYYKFSFDRNPWDKVISHYYFKSGKSTSDISFDKYLNLNKFKDAYNYPIYTIKNNVVVDFLGKYENLDEDLSKVCQKIGLPFDGWLPKAKGNFRKDRQHYRTHYNKDQKELVRQYFKKEIDLLGYEF
ncbi:chondroitin 4-O-sulfotransferase [Oceanobacillus arenosus]|uniref:Chondroitin 4-O-sulfotransferase n=1 Tax=Oceanobacillus arenosus TaxID=1229153 RepID=A0A3D8PME3_9BACI|nr:sulfotransferase family 2 domain-containing protein [Oceanobacillus arenosus]RDW16409.1 chondroitin 4-O-sulfotransferase [Oceanobacillus arenosus]